jgi:hypothetical protein
MYKKLIMASAIAMVATNASAASWNSFGHTAVTHSNEGIEGTVDSTGVVATTPIVKLGAEYSLNDTITFTLSQAKATGFNWPTSFSGKAFDMGAANVKITTAGAYTTASADNLSVGDAFTISGNTTQIFTVLTRATATNGTISPNPTAAISTAAAVTESGTIATVGLGLLSSSATAATYRFTDVSTGGNTTIGAMIQVPAVTFDEDNLQSSSATVAFSAATGAGAAMDALATTAVMAASVPQFKTVQTTAWNAIVDVENDRKKWSLLSQTGAAHLATQDDHTLQITDAGQAVAGANLRIDGSGVMTSGSAVTSVPATITSAVVTVTGDFTWLDDDATTALTQISGTEELDISGTGCTTAALVSTAGAAVQYADTLANACVLQLKSTGLAVIPVQDFGNSSILYTYTAAGDGAVKTSTVAGPAVGKHTLNGASVTAYAVPMGSAVARYLWVNNKGTASAAVSYTATMNGTSYGPYSVATVAGKSSVSVGGLIDADISARGIYVAPSSRAAIELSAPVKANDITVSAAYKHIGDSDRLGLETSDTLTNADNK